MYRDKGKDIPYSVTSLIGTPILEWYVVGVAPRMDYHKEMCLREIGLSAQNMIPMFIQ